VVLLEQVAVQQVALVHLCKAERIKISTIMLEVVEEDTMVEDLVRTATATLWAAAEAAQVTFTQT
jgi:hypothetical protein